MRVPAHRLAFSEEDRRYLHEGLDEILDSGSLTRGELTAAFESAFAEYLGVEHAIACNSGTAALELILRGLEIQGATVIVPTNTFIATAHAVTNSGNRVVFADSDPETLAIDPADARERIDDETQAMILVHIGGTVTRNLGELRDICEAEGLVLIEDAAHAHGAAIDGEMAGTLGVAGGFSFFPTKIATSGEGGIVTTDDGDLADRIRMIRNHGKNPDRDDRVTNVGSNFRMSELAALLGTQQLRRLADKLEARRRIAAHYDDALSDIPGVEPIDIPDRIDSSYYKYIVYLDDRLDRAAVKNGLADRGVTAPSEAYSRLCHAAPLWERSTYCGARRSAADERPACGRWPDCGCSETQTGFPGAEYIRDNHLCLPSYPGLSTEERNHVVESLGDVVEGNLEPSPRES